MSTSLLVLERNISKEPALGYATGTVSTLEAGITSTIQDTSTDSPFMTDDDGTLYQNAWAKIEADPTLGAANLGAVRRITLYTPSGRYVTLNSAVPAELVDETYGIYFRVPPTRMGVHKGLDEYINETLRSLYYRTHHLLTLVTDGDMETSGVTNWTAISGTPTISKETTATTVWMGDQALYVINDTTTENGVKTSAIAVTPGQVYALSALCRNNRTTATYTAKLQLYDATNSEEIASVETSGTSWRFLTLNATIPDDCARVRVYLTASTDGVNVPWTLWDNVCLRNRDARTFDLPSWITMPNQIEGVEYWHGGTAHDDGYAADEQQRYELDWWRVVEDPTGLTPYRLEVDPRPYGYSQLFIRAIRPCAELSADTDATDADADLVKAGVLCRIFADMDDGPDKAKGLAKWMPTYAALLARHQPRVQKRFRVPAY